MYILFLLLSLLPGQPGPGTTWLTDFDTAQKTARANSKYILLNFSGSDWCGPCIRMRKEFFETEAFDKYAIAHLVLLNADFPRNKKNKLSKEQVAKNEAMADKYNPDGNFPYTILLNASGEIMGSWDGLPDVKPEIFINQIQRFSEQHQ